MTHPSLTFVGDYHLRAVIALNRAAEYRRMASKATGEHRACLKRLAMGWIGNARGWTNLRPKPDPVMLKIQRRTGHCMCWTKGGAA